MIVGYIRVSTETQDPRIQKFELQEFASKRNLIINEFIEVSISSTKTLKQRRIEQLKEKLKGGDTLIITELSRIGRTTLEILQSMNYLMSNNVSIITTKDGLEYTEKNGQAKIYMTMLSLMSELERDTISIRTKEALAYKKSLGVKLGKPKGTIQESKYDQYLEQIKFLRQNYGLSIAQICRALNFKYSPYIISYINKRVPKI